jgi:hypothetical protein
LVQEPGVNPVNVSITPLRTGVKEILTVIGNIWAVIGAGRVDQFTQVNRSGPFIIIALKTDIKIIPAKSVRLGGTEDQVTLVRGNKRVPFMVFRVKWFTQVDRRRISPGNRSGQIKV